MNDKGKVWVLSSVLGVVMLVVGFFLIGMVTDAEEMEKKLDNHESRIVRNETVVVEIHADIRELKELVIGLLGG